jgi:hypothetical protein
MNGALPLVHAKSAFRISCRVDIVGAQSNDIRSDRIGAPGTHPLDSGGLLRSDGRHT